MRVRYGHVWTSLGEPKKELFAIPEADQPGLVTGVYRGEKPPMIAEVISDAIAMPVLANANLSFVADVL